MLLILVKRFLSETKAYLISASLKMNLYSCSLKFVEGDINDHYDWTADVMSDEWDPQQARRKLAATPKKLICDALLEQDIFAGVGNIIKNEVLYRVHVHPESLIGK